MKLNRCVHNVVLVRDLFIFFLLSISFNFFRIDFKSNGKKNSCTRAFINVERKTADSFYRLFATRTNWILSFFLLFIHFFFFAILFLKPFILWHFDTSSGLLNACKCLMCNACYFNTFYFIFFLR